MSDIATPPAAPATPSAPPAEPSAPAAPPSTPASLLGGNTPPANPTPSSQGPIRFFGEAVAKDGQFLEGWTENLQKAGFERLANKAALVKDEATFFKTMDDALGLVGKKAGVSYPKAGADESAIMAFRADAGVPESPEGYNLKPAELPPGIDWSDETASAYAQALHQHHIPASAAQELVNLHLAQLTQQTQAAQQQFAQQLTQRVEQAEATFRKEWGPDYDSRLESNRAFVHSRFNSEELADPTLQAALSHPAIVRIVDEARAALREPSTIPGLGREPGGSTHSPAQQAQQIMKENPQWDRNPELHKRVTDLYALAAAQKKRGR